MALENRLNSIGRPSGRTWAEAVALAAIVGLAIGGLGGLTRSAVQPPADGVPAVTDSSTARTPDHSGGPKPTATREAPSTTSPPDKSTKAGRATSTPMRKSATPAPATRATTPSPAGKTTSQPTETTTSSPAPTSSPTRTPQTTSPPPTP